MTGNTLPAISAMEKKQTVLLFLLAGLVAGSICGILAVMRITWAHSYWSYGMHVLIAEQVMRHCLPWMGACGSVFVLCRLITALCERMSSGQRIVGSVVYIGLLCAGLYFAGPHVPPAGAYSASIFVILPCALLCLPRAGRWLLSQKSLISACALACLLLVLGASAWCLVYALRDRPGPSIVVIVIDCLRPDHLGCNGYGRDTSPTIDTLARLGWHYEHAYATAPWTKPSVVSLISSQLPAAHGVVNPDDSVSDQLLLLAEVLRNAGYKNFFINGGNVFLKKEFNLQQGFHHYDYLPMRTRDAGDVVATFLKRAAGIGTDKFFAYLHFMDTHAPYTVNRHNTRYAEKIILPYAPGDPATQLNLLRNGTVPPPELQRYFRDLYDGQIRFVDDALSALMQGLRMQGRLDNTIFIITADHGEEFWEHGSVEHGHSLYNELLQVPLIIAGSPLRPAHITEPVQLIDIMPTVLDIAAIPRERLNLQGISIVPGTAALPAHRALYASATLYGPETFCLMETARKLIYRTDDGQGKWTLNGPRLSAGYELFDHTLDPQEHNNLAAGADVPSDLEDQLTGYMNTAPCAAPAQPVHVGGDDMRRQLESLGYVQ